MSNSEATRSHFRTCNLCEAMCGIEITVQGKDLISIRGDKDDTFSRGHICPKAVSLQDLYNDKDRLKRPMRRAANGWQEIGWDEAFDEVGDRLKSVSANYGKDSIGVYTGNPAVHNYGTLLFAPLFIGSLHTHNRFSATSVDQLAHHFAAYFMFGNQLLLPVPDLDRTDYLLILGANPAVSNGSMMTAPDLANRLKEIRRRGGKVVLIDPRRTETAELADRHLFIRPSADVLLLLSILQVIFQENLIRPDRLASFTDGLDKIGQLTRDYSPERVAPITGIEPEQARELAREFATARSAVCYGRMGLSTQKFGALCQWLINVLNIVTGNLDRPGGAMFTLPAFDALSAPKAIASGGSFGRWRSRVRELPEFAGELPVVTLAEEILTPGKGQIRALVTSAGNPVLSTPNGRQLDRALASLEFMVSVDYYINETTRHANIILPPTSSLEHENYDLAFHLLAIRNTAKFSPALFESSKDQRHDWEIFLELQKRIESTGAFSSLLASLKATVLRRLGPQGLLDLGLRFGPYGGKVNPFSAGLTLGRLKQSPHGLDLGPMEQCLPARLRTTTKRIQLAPELLVKDLARVADHLRDSETARQEYDLMLIGRRQLRSNNSWMHNHLRLVKGREQCTLMINPKDAARLHIAAGEMVKVTSRVGSVQVPVEITDEILAGVVSMPHGWGHNRDGIQLEIAQKYSGASINDLTDEQVVDELIGTAAFSSVWVRVEPIDNRSIKVYPELAVANQ